MCRSLKHLLIIIAVVLLAVSPAVPAGAEGSGDLAETSFSKAPYRVGERLTYNVSFANFGSAAHVELWIAGHGNYFERDGVQLRAHVLTTGVVNAALYAVNNDYVSFVSTENGQPFKTQQFRHDAGSNESEELGFKTRAVVEANPTTAASGQFPGSFDFLSALYRMRALSLTDKASYAFVLTDNGTDYRAELKVKGHQLVKTNAGSFNTIVTQLRFPDDSALDKYRVQILFSDDERHVPVVILARHPSGDIRAELASVELPGANPASVDSDAPQVAASQQQVQPASNSTTGSSGEIPGIPGILTITENRTPPKTDPSPSVLPATPSSPGTDRTKNGVAAPRVTAPVAAITTFPVGLPFVAGEQLNFNIYLENVSQPVGLASFQVRARGQYFGRDGLMLTGKAQTVGTAQTLLSANDQLTTYVDPNTLLPYRFEMILQESRKQANQTVVLDQERGNATTDTGLRIEVPVGTYDLLSVFYALRSFNLRSPKPNAVSLLVNGRSRTLFITFLKRETIELGGQQIPALQLSLTTDDAQPDRNGLRLWVSEDQRRLPLRLTAGTSAGRVRADLAILPIVRQ